MNIDPETAWKLIIENELSGLKSEVESIKRYLYSTGDIKKILLDKLGLFEGQEEMTLVYLQCDGKNTGTEISEITDIKQPNVVRAMNKLKKLFLIYETKNLENKKVYVRNRFDDEMGLAKELDKLRKKRNQE
jgi:DNA-binding MarR family transcriptional regulator